MVAGPALRSTCWINQVERWFAELTRKHDAVSTLQPASASPSSAREVEIADGDPLLKGDGIDRHWRDLRSRARWNVHGSLFGAASARATLLSASTARVMSRAPVQASFCQPTLLLPSIQINIRAGRFPSAE